MPCTNTQLHDLEILHYVEKEKHDYLSKTLKPCLSIYVGLGWTKHWEHYIRNMRIHRCALWNHLVACNQRCGKKFILQRCTFHHPNVYKKLMFFSLYPQHCYQKMQVITHLHPLRYQHDYVIQTGNHISMKKNMNRTLRKPILEDRISRFNMIAFREDQNSFLIMFHKEP